MGGGFAYQRQARIKSGLQFFGVTPILGDGSDFRGWCAWADATSTG